MGLGGGQGWVAKKAKSSRGAVAEREETDCRGLEGQLEGYWGLLKSLGFIKNYSGFHHSTKIIK